ncbi:hypothetical protein [Ralstonia solanacearum]|uniref:hypothetical protein n=1 Tax=Ralstonia solanacearum TaxID=305 RepID=UPI001FEEB184|nr:hypothetical protein [Ralstonia solanacearum]
MIELQPLDIPIAVPLPWPMLEPDGQLLVPKGDVIHSPEEIDLLFTLHRPHRRTDGTTPSAADFANSQFPRPCFRTWTKIRRTNGRSPWNGWACARAAC